MLKDYKYPSHVTVFQSTPMNYGFLQTETQIYGSLILCVG